MNNDFQIENGVLLKYLAEDRDEVVIPEGVSEVGEYAFAGHEEIKRVTVPEGVMKLSQNAFWGCSALMSVSLPESLIVISRFAFWDCGSLESLTVPQSVRSIGGSAFRGCDRLERLVLPESLESIGESCFSDCVCLREINLPGGITHLRRRVFSDCRSLTNIVIPDTVSELDDYLFESCVSLEKIKLPDGLRKIGRHCFDGCVKLAEIDVPESVVSIGSSAFYCTALTESSPQDFVTVGDGILVLYKGTDISVTVPSDVKTVGERAFAYCDTLAEVNVGEGVVKVCDNAFERCRSLKAVKLPDTLRTIGSRIFEDCAALERVILPDGLTHIGSDIFYGTPLTGDTYKKPVTANGKYVLRFTGEADELVLPEGTEVIADGAFSGSRIVNVKLPNGVRTIGAGAFKWCRDLACVNIPSTVTYIGAEAFVSSDELRAVIAHGNTIVGDQSFRSGASLTFEDGEHSFTVTLKNDLIDPKTLSELELWKFVQRPSESAFEQIGEPVYMLPAAISRFEEGGVYAEYVRGHIREAVCLAIDRADDRLLERVVGFGLLTAEDCAACVSYAIEHDRLEQQVTLMRFAHEKFGADLEGLRRDRFSL